MIKFYQLLADDRWFSPGTPASSTTKIGRHNIAEILLKVALKYQNSKIQIKSWVLVKGKPISYKTPTMLLIVKSCKSLVGATGKKKSTSEYLNSIMIMLM